MNYTLELLEPLVASSNSISDMQRKLGLPIGGQSHSYLSRCIRQLGINTDHFINPTHTRFNHGCCDPKRSWQEILVLHDQNTRRLKSKMLRRALIESGRKHVCSKCNMGPMWNGKPLVLQVEHKNGLAYDDRPDNLEFICPNCHTQTETYAKIKSAKGCHYCACGKRMHSTNRSGKCRKCQASPNSGKSISDKQKQKISLALLAYHNRKITF